MRLTVPSMRTGYVEVCRRVLEDGRDVAPRGLRTREVLDAVIILEDPTDALPIGVGRKLNVAIAVAEALQLVGGVSYPNMMRKIARSFGDFTDGEVFHGAYGPRLRPQLGRIVDILKDDPDSRQAVVTIWDPLHDQQGGVRDTPCTVMLQFLIRDNRLILHTTMRSNDVWWGLAYDAFQFTTLQLAMADVLQLEPGPYHHHAVSLHAYERDWDSIRGLELTGLGRSESDAAMMAMPFEPHSGEWSDKAAAARDILAGERIPVNPKEAWLCDVIGAYT